MCSICGVPSRDVVYDESYEDVYSDCEGEENEIEICLKEKQKQLEIEAERILAANDHNLLLFTQAAEILKARLEKSIRNVTNEFRKRATLIRKKADIHSDVLQASIYQSRKRRKDKMAQSTKLPPLNVPILMDLNYPRELHHIFKDDVFNKAFESMTTLCKFPDPLRCQVEILPFLYHTSRYIVVTVLDTDMCPLVYCRKDVNVTCKTSSDKDTNDFRQVPVQIIIEEKGRLAMRFLGSGSREYFSAHKLYIEVYGVMVAEGLGLSLDPCMPLHYVSVIGGLESHLTNKEACLGVIDRRDVDGTVSYVCKTLADCWELRNIALGWRYKCHVPKQLSTSDAETFRPMCVF